MDEGSNLVTQSGATLGEIVTAVKKVTDIVAEIAAASNEQSSGIEQVNKAIGQLDELTQQNAALVEQASAASQAMAEQARGLNDSMQRYQVNGAASGAATSDESARRKPAVEREGRHGQGGAGTAAGETPVQRHGRYGLERVLKRRLTRFDGDHFVAMT